MRSVRAVGTGAADSALLVDDFLRYLFRHNGGGNARRYGGLGDHHRSHIIAAMAIAVSAAAIAAVSGR